ncbi:hypothetical protein [Paraburkholderia flava]|uniref:hypothetical protein n=1 Tax=Paraburkholderia flava TaxID=2547393 RepID=UPI00105E2171|nr:hypothetical protein [Paraburkholderia flava]
MARADVVFVGLDVLVLVFDCLLWLAVALLRLVARALSSVFCSSLVAAISRLAAQALPLCGAAPTFLCRGKEK